MSRQQLINLIEYEMFGDDDEAEKEVAGQEAYVKIELLLTAPNDIL